MNVKAGKTPKIALCRGLQFPVIPPALQNLSTVEQRLVSPRHEFMAIRSLGRERQHGLHGMVVNVPIDVDHTVNQLPRTFDQSQTIQLQLFRKMCYKRPYIYETVRPKVVLTAAQYLLSTELFKAEGIKLSKTWSNDIGTNGEEEIDFIVNPRDKPNSGIDKPVPEYNETSDVMINDKEPNGLTEKERSDETQMLNDLEELINELDKWDETKNDLPINPGTLDTLLMPTDNILLKLAPGEGKRPLLLTLDKHVEELAYPCVFGGEKRHIPDDISFAKRAKSDIMR